MCSYALFATEGIIFKHILYILWHNHVTYIPESYILHRWGLDARYKNIIFENAMNMCQNQDNTNLRKIIILWSLLSKFNEILEMVSDSDIHLSKMDGMLEGFTIETKDFKSKIVNVQSSQSESNVGSNVLVMILREGEEITIHDPLGPATSKRRLKVLTV